jgi:serine/threonine protein phosphatase PrpC
MLAKLFYREKVRHFQVVADAVTTIGTLHDGDKVPNQDASFTLLSPGARLQSAKPRPGRATSNGIYGIGVFDGHGDDGHTASKIACQLAKDTLQRLFTSDYKHGKIEHYLRLTFEIMSNALNAHPCSEDSGTTATIAIVYDGEIVIAHCGDSCGLVVSASGAAATRPNARYVTPMHRTAYERESARIKESGGLMLEGYVVDKVTKRKGIAVTRTLGDRDMRKNGCIPLPEIRKMALHPTDTAITVATDGLWDCEGLVVRHVLEAVEKSGLDPARINQKLLSLATATGPSDDCTIATLVFQ